MPKQGLTKESVVQAANQLIEESGMVRFSMAKLAQRLHIKTASLYNHVESLEKLLEYVGEDAVSQLVGLENQAIAGKAQDAALFALAEAYRTFAREHSELYRVIMSFPKWENPTLEQEAGKIVAPFLQVLSSYGLTKTQQYHWQRVLRAVMSGFAFHEQAGGFAHFPVNQGESFRIAMQCVANGLQRIICITGPCISVTMLAITAFQSVGKKVHPTILSLMRKGGLDIPFMFLLNGLLGVNGIVWATPIADVCAMIVAVIVLVPFWKMLSSQEKKDPAGT